MLQPKSGRAPSPTGEDRDGERTDYLKDREADFLIIEFGKLQDEILTATKERWRAEHTVAILNVLLIAVAYLSPGRVNLYYYTLPFIITLFGGMRALMVWLHIRRAGNYLTKVEEVFGVHPRLGWELRLEKLDESRPYTLGLVGVTMIYWLGMMASTFIFGLGYLLHFW